MTTQLTPLQQRLAGLPHDRYIDFQSRIEGTSEVWFAYWNTGGTLAKRWLGEDEQGYIAQERHRRLDARIQRTQGAVPPRSTETPVEAPRGTYRTLNNEDSRSCQHLYGAASLACPECLSWLKRRVRWNAAVKKARAS